MSECIEDQMHKVICDLVNESTINIFFITGVPYKRTVNYFLSKDWGMKISS